MANVDWDLVKQALEIKQVNEKAAEYTLMQALGGAELDLEVEEIRAAIPVTAASVDYGVSGYTDKDDPRQVSAKSHTNEADGSPLTVHTLVLTNPGSEYKCTFVAAYGPKHQKGGGRTLILVDQGGGHETVMLGTGAYKDRGQYDDRIAHLPGQDVVIAGDGVKFSAPGLGPASVFLERDGKIVSDEVRSMGLPGNGHHFVFEVRFEKRK